MKSILLYFRPRPLAAFFLGISSGFPLTLLLATMSYWLAKQGVDKKTIGFAFGLTTPYALKFLWAPLIDTVPIPLLTRWFGQRRAWLYVIQAALVASLINLGHSDALHDKAHFALWAIITAFCSATQDIVIDGYRIEILPHEQLVHGTAMNQFGYRVGNLLAGAGTIWLAVPEDGNLGWATAYGLTALLVLPGAVAAALCGEVRRVAAEAKEPSNFAAWLEATLIGPLREFFHRIGTKSALLILGFVILYKVGDAMGQNMLGPMVSDLGFSNNDYIKVNKLVGFWSLIAGTALAAPVLARLGKVRALVIAALFMMLANLGFAVVGSGTRNIWLLGGAVGLDSFATGVGLTIFTTFLSELTSKAYVASQFALLSSLAAVARTFLTTQSGRIVEQLGWTGFYIFCASAFFPSLIILYILNKIFFVEKVSAPSTRSSVNVG